jgi:hypothetical protein
MCIRQEMAQRGRLGGLALSASRNPVEYTARARRTFLDGFLREQPLGLPEAERQRRAQAALRFHMQRLAYRSAKSRRVRAKRRNGGGAS